VTTPTGLIPQWGDANKMFALSTQLITEADDLVKELANQQWFQPYNISAVYPTIAPPPVPQLPGAPTLTEVTWTVPNMPAAFTAAPPNLAGLFPAPFSGTQPTLNFGSLPQPQYGSIPASPSIDLNFTYPTVSVDLPTVPTLLQLDVVDFNPFDYTIPDFTGTVPTLTLAAPSIINYVEPPAYASDLLDDLTFSLQSALTDDTDTGLSASTQQAMWDAAREREFRAQADALAALDRDMEQLGYALPPGVWTDSRYKILTETDNTITGLSRDIMVKQAELRLENVMKSRELAITLESRMIDYNNQVAQRAFEAARYETEAAISIYNANVQVYNARIEGFRATVQVYETQIEGVKARVAVLNAEIQFEQAKASINTALVEQYRAQVSAAEAVLDVAKVQVEIIQTQAQIEKTKVDVFSAQVQAFVSTVNAYTAQVEGYKANAEAQGTIEGVYRTQVEAYTAQVQAGAAQANALVEGYKAQVEGYDAQLEGYKAALQAMVEQARAASEFNQAATAEYSAQVQALGTYNEVLVKEWQAILDEGLQIAQVSIKASEANAQLAVSQRQTSIEAIKGAASVMAQLGAAALGAIHWSNSSSWGVSASISTSVSKSTSNVDENIYSSSV
jgi:hypothetical protein